MSDQSTHDSTYEEIERLLNDEEFCRLSNSTRNEATDEVNEITPSMVETPDALNTAFMEETPLTEQHSEDSGSSQPQSQNTKAASSIIHSLLDMITEQEHEPIDLRTPVIRMSSMVAMPKTPTMKSTGTMPRTPTMVSTGTMPKTPAIKSTGTMPRTPTVVSTGTMPRTPTMVSTGTMPTTPATIDLVSPVVETIDLVSPTTEIIDLCSPDIRTNIDHRN